MIKASVEVMLSMRPSFAEGEPGEHIRHLLNLIFCVVFSVTFASLEERGLIDLRLVQELDQHVLRLIEIRSVILIVEDQGWYAKIPRRGECKVMPLDEHEKVCVAGMAGVGNRCNATKKRMSRSPEHQRRKTEP
jgi:hypothetical protein